MPGGLLNLVAYGSENIILNENPSKTFFKSTFKKYTNFGMQTFRLDHTGTNHIQEHVKSTFKFKVKRYGDLLHDTYLSITLPDIYGSGAPVLNDSKSGLPGMGTFDDYGEFVPNRNDDDDKEKYYEKYNFKWIKHLGYNMIDEVSIIIGGQLINKYSGEYLLMLQEQFQSEDHYSHLNEMTGNTDDLNDPAKYVKEYHNYVPGHLKDNANSTDFYPASYSNNPISQEPSIKGKKLYIPINAWFGNSMKQALPLVSLQYHEVDIIITLKPVKELYVVQNHNLVDFDTANTINEKDASIKKNGDDIGQKELFDLSVGTIDKTWKQFLFRNDADNNELKHVYNYLAPEFNNNDISFDMFLLNNNFRNWNPDIHLISTFVFLTDEERTLFAKDDHMYLIKICYEQEFLGILGNHSASVHLNGLVTDIFWRYRRSDANRRNEWTNYSNIKYYDRYNYHPYYIHNKLDYVSQKLNSSEETNEIEILKNLSIMFDGKIREEKFPKTIFKCLQKYRTKNVFTHELKQLYYYSFALEKGLENLQPSGAMNTSKFKDISFIFETIDTPRNESVDTSTLVRYIKNTVPANGNSSVPFNVVIDNATSNQISVDDTTGTCVPVFNKQFRQEKLYTFDLKICSRKYNMLIINSGMGGLKYAR
jgi:hypothetical protein